MPWAVIAGASDGIGEEFALALAQRQINVVLLARRQDKLDEVAQRVRASSGVQARTLSVDLATTGATAAIAEATADLEVGFLVYCAGADTDYRSFLGNTIDAAETMVQRNCSGPIRLVHHFAPAMVHRGRGGIVVLGSGAGFMGAPNMVAYAATKAFDMIFAEALWAELKPQGVDVIGLILGETDTPSLRRIRHQRGLAGPDEPVKGVATPKEVVDAAFAGLPKGPTIYAGKQMRRAGRLIHPIPRSVLVRIATKASAKAMGPA